MSTLHSTTDSAVHPVPSCPPGRTAEMSGAASGRGYVRGTGRTTTPHLVPRQRMAYITPVATPADDTADRALPADGTDLTGRDREQAEAKRAEAEAAFTAYVQERRASLYATAYHLTGDRFAAEDLLQSALFSTYRAWDRISDKAAVGGYLRRTMTNLHISAWRRRKLSEYPTEELPETVGDTDEMGGTELRAVLWQALARLPEQQRTMLVLRYYEGRTDPEIAEILGISVGTVKSSIWRSLRRMREDQALSFGRDEEAAFGELVA
ncbi:RNA polymerase sigma-70 factor, sigma-E family [Streptomyces sp. DvalAA-14]|uniref:SigE family RNA polymerase sigma factor n=1 Tax=unclassified Streptomyces TaxID=2593676 RepID=UPI00081BB89C|nr:MULTISPECIES: SigE family RNA polymerase sigma factor [unclassified Streptomyces]MYS19935.1 SigE family RNA polymerase sigma factor [Streptomyces sp. SID4948]SCD56805.1 RNA polymerase sigma-70 factor, sigma-E family [Streptomyces sp. DvalAA-14]